ncbi:MAG: phosphomethylpyrimidine synthase ThiC [candidate division WOR-3 bacterium]|nr:phosphomethylpyrimidine synthase ThiC [candidate division WOR-3 bacterium]
MTQRIEALNGNITEIMKKAAAEENISAEFIRNGIAEGSIALPHNKTREKEHYFAVGEGLSTKINANIGSSPYHMDPDEELEKLRSAVEAGAHSVMDLSLGSKIKQIRKAILKNCPVMLGTVPIYETGFNMSVEKRDIVDMTLDDFLQTVEEQAVDGVDFMTIHAGVTRNAFEKMAEEGRLLNIVSRGGSMLAAWMKHNNKESLLYTHFDEILEILKEYDVTISLGDGLRPGACDDATDRAQIEELITLGELTQRAWDKGVQVIVEGPGHVPLNKVALNMEIEKDLCRNAPFYVLGPLVNDISAGYDHIAGAIGGAVAAMSGADFLCYVTPAEHLRLPNPRDVREGVIASKIAAFSADLAKGMDYAVKQNREMSIARHDLDWDSQIEHAVDPDKAERFRKQSEIGDDDVCTMCGEFCAVKRLNEIMKEQQ